MTKRHSLGESRPRLRVLVAEDNAVNQIIAATMLRKMGYQVDIVNNGRLAVDAVQKERYDLILMDIDMPEMDGLEATQQIRQLPGGKAHRIIALSAHASEAQREKSIAAGMDGYLVKPLKPHELIATVEKTETARH